MQKEKIQKNGFLTCMADERFQLPLRVDKNYEHTMETLFHDYCEQVATFACVEDIEIIQDICARILTIIRSDEKSTTAFEALMTLLMDTQTLHVIRGPLPIDGYGRKHMNLFRLRSVDENRRYQRQELFHAPKTKQSDLMRKPYRYNLESRPSLYLSTTAYGCWKELKAEVSSHVVGSLFRMTSTLSQPLYIIDLGNRPVDFIKQHHHYQKANMGYQQDAYLKAYPFIAACSVVVPKKSYRNIAEYKLTGMLYQWLMTHHGNQLCGIRYFSCHDAFYSLQDNHHMLFESQSQTSLTRYFINYVFPTHSYFDELGYCHLLKTHFIVSLPRFMKEYASLKDFEESMKYSSSLEVIDG